MAESASLGEAASLRDGHVSSYDAKTHKARVLFSDRDNLVSHPYQVLLPNTAINREECHLDVDEHVLCLCLGNGLETGYVLGTIYDAKNPPTVGNQERWVRIFGDGAHMFYDRELHIFQFEDSFGSYILFKNGDIIMQSKRHIHFNPGDIPAEDLGGPLPLHLQAQFD